jgi:hypothetical protein
MAATKLHMAPVRTESVGDALKRLTTFNARMERRYECSAIEMGRAVHEGRHRETREISKWLAKYHLLTRLDPAAVRGRAIGSTSTSTS